MARTSAKSRAAEGKPTDDKPRVATLNTGDIPAIARIERVPEAAVKAAMQSLGNDRAKVVAALRAAKAG